MMRQKHVQSWLPTALIASLVCLVPLGCGGTDSNPGDMDYAAKREAQTVSNTAGDMDDGAVAEEEAEMSSGGMDMSMLRPEPAQSAAAESPAAANENPAEASKPADRSATTAPSGSMKGGRPGSDGPANAAAATVADEERSGKKSGNAPSPNLKYSDAKTESKNVARQRINSPVPMDAAKEDNESDSVGDLFGGFGGGGGNGYGLLAKDKLGERARRALEINLQPGEELWVIAKAADTVDARDEATPGTGALLATLPDSQEQVPVPLKHTAVEGNIDGYIASVDVQQQFHNPYSSKIEAVYVFPLPQNAAVNEFLMTVGDRKIRGIIREREKAEQIYAAARRQGKTAALMTQERPNIFTQKVANIEPGKQIDINIRYFNTLKYDDGAYEFVFPMVVGPRFNPAGTGDGVGAVAQGSDEASGQKTEVSYLAPKQRSGHDISISVNINAGVDIEDVNSVNHAIDVKNVSESQRRVTVTREDSIPNKDFVLRYKVAGNQIKTALLTHEDRHGKYFTMMLYPPADLKHIQRSPMEMVFVLDCSGSMKGQPIAQAKAAISHALQSLTERDTFQIIRFSNNASQLGPEPVLASQDNIQRGLKYLASLNGTGGTQMIEGIRAALDFPHDEGRFRLVSFMTDGYIGNEQQILGTMYDKLGSSRVFSFGVGSSPNRFLMNRMAVLGRGAVAYLSLNDNASDIMERFNQRISHPAMTDLAIDFGDMRVADVYPQRLPDLIVGRPVVVTGRFKGEPGTVKVKGRVDMEPAEFSVSLSADDAKQKHEGIAAVWARLKIKDMMNYSMHAPDAAAEIRASVIETALAYNLMSSYTAFVAVDSLSQTEGTFGTTVAVPVPVPEGVKYDTTVGGQN